MKSLLSYKVERMNKKTKNIKQQGQVALMVILASALILTLGLSASRQATVETKIDTDQEMLKKAFNAAESGIEHYFGTGSTKYTGDELQGSANLNVKNFGDSQKLSFNSVTLPGDTEYFWLVDRQINGSLGSNYYSTSNPSISICDLDKKTGGLHPSDLLILAGRPAMGKTALATKMAFSAARAIMEDTSD